MKNLKYHLAGIFIASTILLLIATLVQADTHQEARATFEVACMSLEDAERLAASGDYAGCFHFYEEFGFTPWGFLKEIESYETGLTVYFVEWGNGASGVYAVK